MTIMIPRSVEEWLDLAEDGGYRLRAEAPDRVKAAIRKINESYRAEYGKNLISTD